MDRSSNVVVIGAGLGGLSAACTLAARGYSVTVVEKNPWLGGKAAVLEAEGFRFDMGPTILTVPSVLRRIYAEAGREVARELDLVRLDPQWRCFFDGGSVLDLRENTDRMTEGMDADVAEAYRQFLALSKQLHSVSDKYFFWRPVGGITDTLDLSGAFQLSVLKDVLSMRMGKTVGGTIRSFIKDPQLAQLLDHFTQYIGSAPDASPAILCAIAHMQTSEGVWYPRGGTGAVARGLHKLGVELGVTFRTGVGARRILSANGRVAGVQLADGETLRCGAVVSNADSVRTHRELLGGEAARAFEGRRSYEPACSGVVLYLGLKKRYEHLLHHDFVFSRDPHEEFEAIYREGRPAPDPTCYVCAPAVTEPEVAPPGGEALYILVHTPYLRPGHDWSKMLPEYRKVILDKLARTAGLTDLEDNIVFERALTPQDIHDRYSVLNGAIYGIASHGRFLGAFKPSNRSPDIDGLYLAGGAAHPGPGMPMVMMSGWIAADAVDQDRIVEPEGTRSCVLTA
ncbi:MAG TPA: phytoene desaturase family protein [Bryobacteraceae bacterium]|nr:phytoene desaturase family protein [Bryobacteraceae bacterium]